jgi:hypothetical protein
MSKVHERLEEQRAEEKRASRIDYEMTAFMLKRPHSNTIYRGPMRLRGREAHRKLIEIAKRYGLYVWYAQIQNLDKGDKQVPHAIGIHLIDWDSVPDDPHQVGIDKDDLKGPIGRDQAAETKCSDDLKCRICNQQCSSRPGYTLHMKTHTDDTHNPQDEAADLGEDPLRCPVCNKKCSSASGLTLHRQAKGH